MARLTLPFLRPRASELPARPPAIRTFSGPVLPVASLSAYRALRAVGPRARSAYSGAAMSRLNEDWIGSSLPPDDEIRNEARRLRIRSRELYRNTAIVRRYFSLLPENVIGPEGFEHLPQIRFANGNLDERSNDILKAGWQDYTSGPVTVDGEMGFLQYQHLALKTTGLDGELFVRTIIGSRERHGLSLQSIDADVVDETYILSPGAGRNEVRMGIEIDEVGRRLAYWLRERNYLPGMAGYDRRRVAAAEIRHLFWAERVNQTRGVPWIAPVMGDLHTLRGFVEAHLLASRIASSQMGWLEYKDDADPPPGDPNAEDGDDQAVPEQRFEMEPAMVRELPYGMKFQPWAPEYPNTNFAEFVKSAERWIASGLDVSYTSLANDLEGVNFSSIRAGLLAERDHWRFLQQLWIDWFLTPIYRTWVRTAYLSGALPLPTPDVERYCAVRWQPRRWPWVDPLKDLQAAELELKLNLTSEQRLAAERGADFSEILEERAAARKEAGELGLTLASDAPTSPAAPAGADPAASDAPPAPDDGEPAPKDPTANE